jgi:hypothetical protein
MRDFVAEMRDFIADPDNSAGGAFALAGRVSFVSLYGAVSRMIYTTSGLIN